jgi:RNA polymerase sigma-70 factor (ECF subfamily)
MFFSIYAKIHGVWLAPAWLEGREVIAVFDNPLDAKPSYFMWLEWRGNEITFIHDYKYVRYVMADAELTFAPSPAHAGANRVS